MNNHNENEKPTEPQAACAATPVVEPFEAEPKAPSETTDSREPVEGGYGWGV